MRLKKLRYGAQVFNGGGSHPALLPYINSSPYFEGVGFVEGETKIKERLYSVKFYVIVAILLTPGSGFREEPITGWLYTETNVLYHCNGWEIKEMLKRSTIDLDQNLYGLVF